ncbi:heavy metal-associated isoprenylated plant protein 41-like [Pistacia vera]|uniref:heavy metal-associated isoprenylated plant protein 41-like n=1 Tax=Pistacia vera TaxID=55513 RepID=UPI00126391CA|nr:heavy metal-associated isoprenylated plant protein 41-like [Pistacia vera]
MIIAAREEEEEKWVKHYSSTHQILLVGEGDFSFSLSLALSFGSAFNICTSSLDSYVIVVNEYKKAKSNLRTLEKLGAYILHVVDATKMKLHPHLRMRKFDRIIFNFPHAGYHGRNIICWYLEELAYGNSLSLIECVSFKKEDYPGYNNKRGDGWRCDESFRLGECSTFKFIFSQPPKKKSRRARNKRNANRRPHRFNKARETLARAGNGVDYFVQEPHRFDSFRLSQPPKKKSRRARNKRNANRRPHRFNKARETLARAGNGVDYFVQEPHRFDSFRHPSTNFNRNMNDQQESARISSSCFNIIRETLGRAGHRVDCTVHGSLIFGSERDMEEATERTLNGYAFG